MTSASDSPARRSFSPRAWLELVRIPNLPTAWADVLMGFLVTHEDYRSWPVLIVLLGASSALYSGGMALNDVFDAQFDRELRPNRPIPSGRVVWKNALRAALALLTAGVVLSWTAAWLAGDWRPGIVGTLLALAVWVYDGVLKRTPAAPLVMGACRTLNVLLGMSAAADPWHPLLWVIALGIGVYIAGVTWYARTEATPGNRPQLLFGMAVMAAGIALLAWFPSWEDPRLPDVNVPTYTTPDRWRLLMGLLGALIGWRALLGVIEPVPARVQMAVKQAILSLIVLDASVCFVFRGLEGALPILLLIVPAMWLGRWIYST